MKASELEKNKNAVIIGFSDKMASRRLLEMGFVPGAGVVLTGKGPFGNPLAFKVGLLHAALRKEEADMIEVNLS